MHVSPGCLGTIIAAKLNAPGSWHDSRLAQGIYEKLRNHTPSGFYLVADTAFPRGADQIQGKIRAPIKTSQRIQGTSVQIEERLAFDRELLSYRQTAEWGMRAMGDGVLFSHSNNLFNNVFTGIRLSAAVHLKESDPFADLFHAHAFTGQPGELHSRQVIPFLHFRFLNSRIRGAWLTPRKILIFPSFYFAQSYFDRITD
jgi:hypothetical protein